MAYQVILTGSPLPATDEKTVAGNLARVFKIPEQRAAGLLSGKSMVIKKGVSREEAEKYRAACLKAGAACRIAQQDPGVPDPPAQKPVASPPVYKTENKEEETDISGPVSFLAYFCVLWIISLFVFVFIPHGYVALGFVAAGIFLLTGLSCRYVYGQWVKDRASIIWYAIFTGGGIMVMVLFGWVLDLIARPAEGLIRRFRTQNLHAMLLVTFAIALIARLFLAPPDIADNKDAPRNPAQKTPEQISRSLYSGIEVMELMNKEETGRFSGDLEQLADGYGRFMKIFDRVILKDQMARGGILLHASGSRFRLAVRLNDFSEDPEAGPFQWMIYTTDMADLSPVSDLVVKEERDDLPRLLD